MNLGTRAGIPEMQESHDLIGCSQRRFACSDWPELQRQPEFFGKTESEKKMCQPLLFQVFGNHGKFFEFVIKFILKLNSFFSRRSSKAPLVLGRKRSHPRSSVGPARMITGIPPCLRTTWKWIST